MFFHRNQKKKSETNTDNQKPTKETVRGFPAMTQGFPSMRWGFPAMRCGFPAKCIFENRFLMETIGFYKNSMVSDRNQWFLTETILIETGGF